MADQTVVNEALIASLDKGDMLHAIITLPEQLESAYAAACDVLADAFVVSDDAPAPRALPAGVAICGMGGSAIGADLVLAALPGLPVPAAVIRGYDLPVWVDQNTLVIGVSYSGDTEETVSCLTEALARGCTPVCVASGGAVAGLAREHGLPLVLVPGGQQPRASLGLLAAPVLAALEAAGLCPSQAGNVRETVELLRLGNRVLGPEAPEDETRVGRDASGSDWHSASDLARLLHGKQAVIYGAGPTVAVARRWKGQINENAKAPAFWNELPELDHNEIMGWTSLPAVSAGTVALFLNDAGCDRRLARRAALTADVLAERSVGVEQVWAPGHSQLARLFSMVQLGDYASYYLALLYGVDPSPVAAIQDFKAKLSSGA